LTDPNTISNSDTNPEDNNTSSDKSLSGDNISTDLNSITDHSNEASNTDHSNKTIITLTRNCTPMSISINIEELDLTNMSIIFEKTKEIFLVEKVKKSLHIALNHYWDAPLDCFLIAILLDSRCKLMRKLDSWERDKAVDLL
ncbi:13079_t:CDS:2, partial [Gigaspora margarita]